MSGIGGSPPARKVSVRRFTPICGTAGAATLCRGAAGSRRSAWVSPGSTPPARYLPAIQVVKSRTNRRDRDSGLLNIGQSVDIAQRRKKDWSLSTVAWTDTSPKAEVGSARMSRLGRSIRNACETEPRRCWPPGSRGDKDRMRLRQADESSAASTRRLRSAAGTTWWDDQGPRALVPISSADRGKRRGLVAICNGGAEFGAARGSSGSPISLPRTGCAASRVNAGVVFASVDLPKPDRRVSPEDLPRRSGVENAVEAP